MARRKSGGGGGPSTGLIVTLIFFILTTFIAGTLAYFGFADQEKEKKAAVDALKKENDQKVAYEKQEARKLVYKIALGNQTDEELKAFQGYLNTRDADIKEEISNLSTFVGTNLDKFAWKLDKDRPDATPIGKNIISLLKEKSDLADSERKAKVGAEDDKKKAEDKTKEVAAKATDEKNKLEAAKTKLENDLTKMVKDKEIEFKAIIAELTKKGQEIDALRAESAQLKEDSKRAADAAQKKIDALVLQVDNFKSKIAIGPDLLARDTKKADVEKREGNYIYLNRGSADFLRQQTTFTVLPNDAVWSKPEEKDRLAKGEIEVIEILGPNSARAKIVGEREPIRNPIRSKDQLFNVAWSPNVREHIAFAGIIDLNGDGIDDNKVFMEMLTRQGVAIDQYLDLQDRTIKGKGMTISTKFLVLGPDVVLDEDFARGKANADPRLIAKQEILSKMAEMKASAAKLGVQIIEYRKFLAAIGIKPPERPAPADYGSSAYMQKGDKEKAIEESNPVPKN